MTAAPDRVGDRPQPGRSGRATATGTLTPREWDVLVGLADGMSMAEIGKAIHVSPHTVKKVLHGFYRRNDVGTAASAVALAMRRGWIR